MLDPKSGQAQKKTSVQSHKILPPIWTSLDSLSWVFLHRVYRYETFAVRSATRQSLSAEMPCHLRLSALIATLLAASVANAWLEGDCADVYDTGSGNCNVG